MPELMTIQGAPLQVKEYKGRRVVTFKDIDTVHQRPEGTANKRFLDNRQRFISGVDFFSLTKDDLLNSGFRNLATNNRGLTFITESGYLMLVKSFTDDRAWKVQRDLVDAYFRVQGNSVMEDSDIRVSVIRPEIFLEAARIMASVPDSKQNVINCLRHIVSDIDEVQTVTVQVDDKMIDVPVMENTIIEVSKRHIPKTGYGIPFNYYKLANTLNERRLSNDRFAEMVGCVSGSVSSWVNGHKRPSTHYRNIICDVLGVPRNFFNGRSRRIKH